ncbi:MAG: lamin tail domain-containing protein, partial [Verrucomicrobiae bacterium]|nr:lamin tail domain-containing protein [Verrucomicrobiae bacterium]
MLKTTIEGAGASRQAPAFRPAGPSSMPRESLGRRVGLTALLLAVAMGPVGQADELIGESAPWRYFKGVTEASAPDPAAWRATAFDDSAWLTGPAPFFYELSSGYSGNTELADLPDHYVCVFLRRAFNLANVEEVETLILDVQSDDGCLVWLNGEEIARLDMPEGEPSFQTPATDAGDEPLIATITITNRVGLLLPGANVLAVQAANASLSGSSDFLFNATLNSTVDSTPPVMEEAVPPPETTVRELTFIEVIFSENVTGVEATDLLIDGMPATGLEVHSPRDYTFNFPEPGEGPVTIAWATGHGITDLSSKAYPFTGTGWGYILDKTVPVADVIISEFLADNEGGLRDGDGDREDWIELYNREPEAVELEGWYLTDDAEELTKWEFPAATIPAGGYLLVWASNKDPERPGGELHTNFKLSSGGEYLALVDPNGNAVSAFSPEYPVQRNDVSYGRDLVEPDIVGYFLTPTPGRANASSGSGFAPDPVFSLPAGLYVTNRLEIELSAPSGDLRYTLNGAAPTESGTPYTGPIEITQGTILKARVFQAGLMPSRVVAAGYSLVFDDLAGFSSNLPLLVVQPVTPSIPADSRVPVYVTAIEPFRGRTALLGTPSHTGMGSMEIRGQSSTGFPKKQYNLELNDAAGLDLEVPLLGLPAESDWVLNGPYTDKSLLNNFLAFELHEQMGHYAVRRRFVEVFIDQSRER